MERSTPSILCVLALFLILGPPIGGIAYATLLVSEAAIHGRASPAAGQLAYVAFVLSYPLGGIPALLVGLVAAVAAAKGKSVSLAVIWLATALAVVMPVLLLFAGWRIANPDLFDAARDLRQLLFTMLALSVGGFPAATVCWLIARRLGCL